MSDSQIENIYPLTALQQGILFHTISEPDSGVFIDQIHFDVRLLDDQLAAFKQSWACLIDKHAVLRTAFIWKELKQAVQVVKKNCELEWHTLDYTVLSASEQQERFADLLMKDRHTDFDLTSPPLSRHHVIKMDASRYRILWTFHHLILDGWSVANLFIELKFVFGSIIDGRRPESVNPRPFSEFIDYCQAKDSQGSDHFWKNYLKGYHQPANIAAVKHTASAMMAMSEQDIQCGVDDNQMILEFARRHRLSINTLVHAAWSLLLMTYTGRDDVVYGTTYSGRDPQLCGIEKMVGVFINTLPVRVSRQGRQNVKHWLQALQANLNQLKEYEHCALTEIKRCSELEAQVKLFDCLLVVENYPYDQFTDPNTLEFQNVVHKEQSNFPCVLLMLPYSPLQFRLIYDSNLYADQQVHSLLEQLRHCLLSLCVCANKTVNNIDVVPVHQRAKILEMSLDYSCCFEFDTPVHDLIQSFSESDAIAISGPEKSLTYRQLNSISNLIAQELLIKLQTGQHNADDANKRIAICLSRHQLVIESMIAVLKSGAAYIVIDPEYPKDRIKFLLDHSHPVVCITGSDSDLIDQHKNLDYIFIDQISHQSNSNTEPVVGFTEINDESPAYILYTSGSTGQPKGVRISHANLAYSTQVRTRCYASDPSVFLLLSPFIFDSSVAGIYWTLTTGGRLIVSEPRLEQDMKKLTDQIYQHQVTHTLCLPGLYELILEHASSTGTASRLQSLKTVILAGEALTSSSLLQLHRELLPETKIYNEYGPTEATVWSSFYDASEHRLQLPLPIGKAIPGTQILIIDQSNRLSPLGVPGEICIAGPGVSQGYLNADELTRQQFIELEVEAESSEYRYSRFYKTGDLGSMDMSGIITCLGRMDDQIKIRGHRLEPGEIEQTLLENPVIDQAVALSVEAVRGETVNDINHLSEPDLDKWLNDALADVKPIDLDDLLKRAQSPDL